MKPLSTSLLALALAGFAWGAYASDYKCKPVVGTVKLTSESPICTIATKLPTNPFLYTAIGSYNPPDPGSVCFQTTVKFLGFSTSNGFSGVTTEPLNSASASASIPTPVTVASSNRQVLTAQSWIPIKAFGKQETVIYTSDIIVVDPSSPKRVIEQITITGTNGQGSYQGATGGFVIIGNSIGQEALIQGEICQP